MNKVMFGCLLLMYCVLVGCNNFRSNSQSDQTGRPSRNSAQMGSVENEDKLSDGILFRGKNMTLVEKERGLFRGAGSVTGKTNCLTRAGRDMRAKLPALGFTGKTEYLEFEAISTYSFGPDKFTVNFSKSLFSKLSSDSVEKLDELVGFSSSRSLYLLKTGNISYLLVIGNDTATSGYGHYYRNHLILPVNPDKPVIEFSSTSDDPQRVILSETGSIAYMQVDLEVLGAIDVESEDPLPLSVSLHVLDTGGTTALISKTKLRCNDIDAVFSYDRE